MSERIAEAFRLGTPIDKAIAVAVRRATADLRKRRAARKTGPKRKAR